MEIFQNVGMVQNKAAPGDYKCVVIQIAGGDTYFGEAPVMGISISQQVDFNLSKTMAGNFNLVTFQDLPVVINIQGLIVYANACRQKGKKAGNIAELYKQAKASNKSSLVTITIGSADSTAVYKGVITAFSQVSSQNFPGMFQYTLGLFGVRS